MKITGITAGLSALALLGAPLVRHHLGSADAQTRPPQGADPSFVPPTVIGMNLGSPSYYNSEEMFTDPIRSHGTLSWESEPRSMLTNQVKLDDGGHPLDVPSGSHLSSRLKDNAGPTIPGDYHCKISPGWRVETGMGGQVSQSGTNITISVPKGSTGTLIPMLIAAKDHVNLTEFSCRYPGAKGDAVFRQDFLDDMKPFRVIRFMDQMLTNNAPLRKWSERSTPESMEQIRQGMALEFMVALANQLHADPWFTLPMDVDDGYYSNFATYVRDHLDPGLKAYVELSNEVWNDSFQQSKDATARGKLAYPGVSDDKANDYYYADRVRDLMGIWSKVYAGQEKRIVRVLASQMWPQRGDQRLGHKDTWKYVDALAIAPYWGNVPFDVAGTGKARIDGMLAKSPGYIDAAMKDAHANKVLAARYGLPLMAYEGGPGFFAFQPEMEKDVRAAEADPRFYDLYQTFLRRWQKEIGGVLVLYQSTADTSFGHLQYTGQPLAEAPKMRAVVDFIGQPAH